MSNGPPSAASPEVVFVGAFYFPDGNAAATRVLHVGKALRDAGLRVAFAGMEHRPRPEDRCADGTYRYRGFPYVSEECQGNSRTSRLRRAWFTHVTGATTMRRLRTSALDGARAIVAYQASSPLLWRLWRFCRRRRIALIADCTEWFQPTHLPGGRWGPFRWDDGCRRRFFLPMIRRVIVVSSYLERHYRSRGCATLRVPPLVDIVDVPDASLQRRPEGDGRLHLVYAGSPGKKDLIGNAIRALESLLRQRAEVVLHLVGPSREQIVDCLQGDSRLLDDLGEALICHGRVDRQEALRLIAAADFSILVRPDVRYAHAGFPSKLSESLSLGIPVICNVTSDIAEYVRDGKEGMLLHGSTVDDCAAGIRRVLDLPREQWGGMRRQARQRAEECLDYRRYVGSLGAFVREAIEASPPAGCNTRQSP